MGNGEFWIGRRQPERIPHSAFPISVPFRPLVLGTELRIMRIVAASEGWGWFEPQWLGLVKSMTRRAVAGQVGLRLLMVFGGWLGALSLASAAPEAGAWQAVVASLDVELPRLLAALDDNQFEVRHAAQTRLDELIADPTSRPKLAGAVAHRLAQPGLSLEAGETLERLLARLPKPTVAAMPRPGAAELDRLITSLDDNSYPVRIAASDKLTALISNGPLAREIGDRLKQHLADPAAGCGAQKTMEALWQQARGVWLLADECAKPAQPVSAQQIEAWLDDLALSPPAQERRMHDVRVRIENARRELLDLLARDAEVPRIKAALEKRLVGMEDEVAVNRIRELFDLTRPAMVAEYWQAGRHTGVQHLLIGIPNHSPNAQRASHFDRIDEHTAHCVSGNALSPGDYPVDVFFPHPRQEDAQFHLVNLPTPRFRMAYEFSIAGDEAARHARVSEKTLSQLLAARRLATTAELNMFRFLDHRAVSRFAGSYLLAVRDQPAPRNSASAAFTRCFARCWPKVEPKKRFPAYCEPSNVRGFCPPRPISPTGCRSWPLCRLLAATLGPVSMSGSSRC